jgi:spore maturation protein CgeB
MATMQAVRAVASRAGLGRSTAQGGGRHEPLRRSFDSPAFQMTWVTLKRMRLHQLYIARREHYAAEAERRGLVYRRDRVASMVQDHLARRGYSPTRRRPGDVHTFAFIPRVGGNPTLYPDLHHLGPVTEFDYTTLGCTMANLRAITDQAAERRAYINAMMLAALRQAHERRPVDWLFAYGNGYEIEARTVRQIVDELGIPVVNMCLDDKQSWTGPRSGGQRVNQVDLVPVFDLSWTSARVACEWYLVEGGRPVYLPEGFDAQMYHPLDGLERDIPVSFVGSGYGYRPAVVRHIEQYGLEVRTFGPGWPSGWTGVDEQVRIFNRSIVNLGMGGVGFSEHLTNVKTRDFEVPGTGGGAYLTRFNPDLALHFDIGEEILCYSTREEAVELIRHCLARPDEAAEIGRRGRARCMSEHRWLHRYLELLGVLGVLDADAAMVAPPLTESQ